MRAAAGATSTLTDDLLRASLMCGLRPGGPGVHQTQLFYCVWRLIGRVTSMEPLQRAIETGVDHHRYWIRPPETRGVYALTAAGLQKAQAIAPQQRVVVPAVPYQEASFTMESPDLVGAAFTIRNTGGTFDVRVGDDKLTGKRALDRLRQLTGAAMAGDESRASRQIFNYGIHNGWHLEWDLPGDEVELAQLAADDGDDAAAPPSSADNGDRPRVTGTFLARFGQSRFRRNLIQAYNGECCISNTGVRGTLQAAHIVPCAEKGEDEVCNGLLLRADIHNLFDLDLLRIDPTSWCVLLHRKLRGTVYEQFSQRRVQLPENQRLYPAARHFHQRYANKKSWSPLHDA